MIKVLGENNVREEISNCISMHAACADVGLSKNNKKNPISQIGYQKV